MATHNAAAETRADPRWAAVIARDGGADGKFVYAVRTTGIYCRPGCPSRHPKPENVAFYPTPKAAAAAGFRPCRRCRPDSASPAERQQSIISALCRYIEQAAQPPTLAQLAAHAGLSPHHLHRLFKAGTGLTPHAYAGAVRAARLRQHLAEADSVTSAIFAAGYNAGSRCYAEADARLGMTPAAYRAGGAGQEIRYASGPCTLGQVLIARSGRGLCAILLGDEPATLADELAARFPAARLLADGGELAQQLAEVVRFVDAPQSGLKLPLDIRGTAFQQRVWQALRAIPPGQTASYTEIAARLGMPKAVRAVAGACAANALAVAIPCHRAVRSDGTLAGYRWGVERKRALLAREAEA